LVATVRLEMVFCSSKVTIMKVSAAAPTTSPIAIATNSSIKVKPDSSAAADPIRPARPTPPCRCHRPHSLGLRLSLNAVPQEEADSG
jgi:hypothetical protein